MNVATKLGRYFDLSSLAFMKAVPISELRFDGRAKYKCKFGCKNYNRKYSCPPHSLQLFPELETHYRWAILFATSSSLPDNVSQYMVRALSIQRENEIQRVTHEIGVLLTSYGVQCIPLSGGSCKRCRECSITRGEICRKPELRQVSMEAIGIDCQKTMHYAGFDFQMPNNGSINRCGCILVNDQDLSGIYFNGHKSYQRYIEPDTKRFVHMCQRLQVEYSDLFTSVELMPFSRIRSQQSPCEVCSHSGRNFSCPPYSDRIDLNLWHYAILWEWRPNIRKATRYNMALKTTHAAFFSLGNYFALSLRDCHCDECPSCQLLNLEYPVCSSRKMMAPSMQSQGIDPHQFGEGRFGMELL